MKLNKTIFLYCTSGAILLLITALLMDLPFISATVAFVKISTIQAVFLGLFGSLAVGAIISLITYFVERDKLIKSLRDITVHLYKDLLNIVKHYKTFIVQGDNIHLYSTYSWGQVLEKDLNKLDTVLSSEHACFCKQGTYNLLLRLSESSYSQLSSILNHTASLELIKTSRELAKKEMALNQPISGKINLEITEMVQIEWDFVYSVANLYNVLSIFDIAYPFREKWSKLSQNIQKMVEDDTGIPQIETVPEDSNI